jgi:transketolase
LENFGYLDKNHTSKFEQNGTNLFAHAHKNLSHGIEYSGGSLGLGLSFGVGIALANRMKDLDPKIIVLVGDGECDEGIVWESLMSISNFNLDNFLVIVDRNKMQSDGEKIQIMDQKDIALKFKSFGFDVCEIDGHDHQQIKEALNQNQTCPKAIIANTIKGKGIGFMESNSNWHHGYLNENLFNEALEDLEKGYG